MITDNGPWLAADKMPDHHTEHVDVWGDSLAAQTYDVRQWVALEARELEPWHIWRYSSRVSGKLIHGFATQCRKHKVSPANGEMRGRFVRGKKT